MSNHSLFIITLLFNSIWPTIIAFGQEKVFETDLSQERILDSRRIYPVVDEDESTTLYIYESQKVTCKMLDKDYQETDRYTFPTPPRMPVRLFGQNIEGNQHHLFFANRRATRFFVHVINVTEKRNYVKPLSIKAKGERHLESISYKDRFYLVRMKQFTSIMVIYEFKGSELISRKELDLSEPKPFGAYRDDLYSRFIMPSAQTPLEQELSADMFEIRDPYTPEHAAEPAKLYVKANKIYMTVEKSHQLTKVIKVDLGTYEYSVDAFTHEPLVCGTQVGIKTNSFLWDDVLFQVKVCRSKLRFSVTRLSDKKVPRSYTAQNSQSIFFKSGAIRQETGALHYRIETSKALNTRQFLRQLNNSQLGILVFAQNDRLIVRISGYKVLESEYITVDQNEDDYGYLKTPLGIIRSGLLLANDGEESFRNFRSIHFDTKLEPNTFRYIKGNVRSDIFQRIRSFEKSLNTTDENRIVFKNGDAYLYGYYSRVDRKFILEKFDAD